MTAEPPPLDGILIEVERLAPKEFNDWQEAAAGTVRALTWLKRVEADGVDKVPMEILDKVRQDVSIARAVEADAIDTLVRACEAAGGVDD